MSGGLISVFARVVVVFPQVAISRMSVSLWIFGVIASSSAHDVLRWPLDVLLDEPSRVQDASPSCQVVPKVAQEALDWGTEGHRSVSI